MTLALREAFQSTERKKLERRLGREAGDGGMVGIHIRGCDGGGSTGLKHGPAMDSAHGLQTLWVVSRVDGGGSRAEGPSVGRLGG